MACCRDCNNRKGDRTLSEIGWKLGFRPQEPRLGQFWMRGIDKPVEQWRPFLEMNHAA
ncbi:HNH endonuclease family protein [Mycobacteroides abscessus subsp. abscessus]|nr:HNH endonuclease family protein [Mycobacteroides abscessus subsp. abscessus]